MTSVSQITTEMLPDIASNITSQLHPQTVDSNTLQSFLLALAENKRVASLLAIDMPDSTFRSSLDFFVLFEGDMDLHADAGAINEMAKNHSDFLMGNEDTGHLYNSHVNIVGHQQFPTPNDLLEQRRSEHQITSARVIAALSFPRTE